MKTLNLRGRTFEVRDNFVEVLNVVAVGSYKSIQDLLVQSLPLQPSWISSEYAAAVNLMFPDSTIPDRAQARATADIRKYNRGELSGMETPPETKITLLDAGQQKRSMAGDVKEIMKGLLNG